MRSLFSLAAGSLVLAVGTLAPAGPAFAHQASAQQWSLDAQHFDSARVWPLSTGRGVTVAIVDSGVDPHHPDLTGRILPGADFTGTAADGRVDLSSEAHGTSVASIIAGGGTGADGVAGLSPDATIMPIRVSSDVTSDLTAVAQGIEYATTHGARIINISLCTPVSNPQIRAAVAEAVAHDVVVIAAAGNDGQDSNQAQYPAALPGVVAVAASDRDGTLWPQSESGPYLGLTAPGVDVYAAGPQGSRQKVSGTSFAAPQVAAAAALLRARFPTETAAQIIYRLTATADRTGTARDQHRGYGAVDPYRALILPTPPAATDNPLLQPVAAAAVPRPAAHGGHRTLSALAVAFAAVIVASGAWFTFRLSRRGRVSRASR